MNSILVTPEKRRELYEETMRRLRWRLWFAFAESKYTHFCYKGNKKRPHYKNIDDYCQEQWGKTISVMSKTELSEKIAIVTKWK